MCVIEGETRFSLFVVMTRCVFLFCFVCSFFFYLSKLKKREAKIFDIDREAERVLQYIYMCVIQLTGFDFSGRLEPSSKRKGAAGKFNFKIRRTPPPIAFKLVKWWYSITRPSPNYLDPISRHYPPSKK